MNEIIIKRRRHLRRGALDWIKNFYALLQQWNQNSRTRRDLSALSEHQLRDIGVEKDQVRDDYRQSFIK